MQNIISPFDGIFTNRNTRASDAAGSQCGTASDGPPHANA